jgi:hypothetical protein
LAFRNGLEKITGRDFQSVGDSKDVLDRDIPLAAFNRTDVGSVKLGAVGELFLRQPGFISDTPYVVAKNLFRIAPHISAVIYTCQSR